MTELAAPLCIAPNCEQPAIPDNALCAYHREKLQRIEDDLIADAGRKIRADMRQFERLILVEPPLHSAEIAHRMPMPIREVRKLLKKFKDDRA
jgi:hypothetical protein